MLLGLSAKEKAVFISLVVNACYPSKTEGNVTIFLLKACFAEGNGKQKSKGKALLYTVFQNFVTSVNFVNLRTSNLPLSSLHAFLDISHICIPTVQAIHCSLSVFDPVVQSVDKSG